MKAEVNCEIYKSVKKMLEKFCQFLSSEQPCELKSLDVALNIAGVEKIRLAWKTCCCSQPGGYLIQVLSERSIIDGGNLCPLWLVILKHTIHVSVVKPKQKAVLN